MASQHALAAVWNGPDEGFQLTEIPLPPLADGEVVVEVEAVTLCGSDLHTIAGERSTPLPTVLGHEMVGTVVAVEGRVETHDGRRVTPGMRVTWSVGASCGDCPRCRRGLPQKCRALRKYGHEAMTDTWRLNGGLATHCHLVPGTGIVAVPDELATEVVAPANCATATVVSAFRQLQASEAGLVVVQGCGMLGLTAVNYAKARGVEEVVASDVAPERLELARRCGASVVATPDDLPDQVAAHSDGEGAEVVLDVTGSSTAVAAALDLLALGGRLGLVGSVFPAPAIQLDPEMVVRRMLTLRGVHNYTPDDLAVAVDFLTRADHELLRSLVAKTFPLAELDHAVTYARTKRPPRVAVDPRMTSPGGVCDASR
jgi:putative phosphonate catabolism associated alcohol dehydrogenase